MNFGAVRRSWRPGRLNYEQPLEVGDGIEIGGQQGIVSTIEPVLENARYGSSCSCRSAANCHADVS